MNEVFAAKNKEVTIVREFLLQIFWRIRRCQKNIVPAKICPIPADDQFASET